MKINVCYKVTVEMEVSDEFKSLETMPFVTKNDVSAWEKKVNTLENTILCKLPKGAEIYGVIDSDTNEIIYEN